MKYPKVGEENSEVKVGVAHIESGEVVWMNLNLKGGYVPRVFWTHQSKLAVQVLNRKQDHLQLFLCNPADGKGEEVMSEKNETWIDVTDDVFFFMGKREDQFLYTSEKSGFRHVYLFHLKEKKEEQITSGHFEVESIAGVDEENELVYFYAHKEKPHDKLLFSVSISSKEVKRISNESEGTEKAHFSPDFSHFVSFYSNVRSPTKVTLKKSDGQVVRVILENDIPALKEFGIVFPEFFSFHTSDGEELSGLIIKPPNFNEKDKYSVLFYGYGEFS